MKFLTFFVGLCICIGLSACQSPKSIPQTTPTLSIPTFVPVFTISGKIGITTQTTNGKQAVSAFYVWSQAEERFAIDLTGAMGFGATSIRYDGNTATLSNAQGTLTAHDANDLLKKATGWHAPIDKLPYWVMGRTADGDTDSLFEQNKLIKSHNGDWTAVFEYADTLPKRLTITHTDGHRVVLTITHTNKK